MITIRQLIRAARERYSGTRIAWVHPTMYVVVTDEAFEDLHSEARLIRFASALGVEPNDLANLSGRAVVALVLATEAELNRDYSFLASVGLSRHWLPLLDDVERDEWVKSLPTDAAGARALHFYGFKGGQGRSTVAGMLAKSLADSGFRVLIVDCDVEAPSLHILFGSVVQATFSSLLGLCSSENQIEPIPAYAGREAGFVRLLAAYPTLTDFQMDAAAFVLRVALDGGELGRGIERLRGALNARAEYDYVLFDHRTGLSASVLPVVSAWPGSVVICAKADGLTEGATSVVQTLLAAFPPIPGAFVCFASDPDRGGDAPTAREAAHKDRLLEVLADAVSPSSPDDDEISSDDLNSQFVYWSWDRAFLDNSLPTTESLAKLNRDALLQLRGSLGVPTKASGVPRASSYVDLATSQWSPSGAADSGWFIETPEISKLLISGVPSSYVFGRKGTGKTRLFREMVSRGLAVPLHCAADYIGGGLQSQGALAQTLLVKSDGNYEVFWWTLISLTCQARGNDTELGESIRAWASSASSERRQYLDPQSLLRILDGTGGVLTLLIDGVETAVEAAATRNFIEALFRTLSTLQNDSAFAEKIRFRLFIRPDLAVGIQNVEQQVFGRRLDLRWDEDAIFNYALAEIARTVWFRVNFASVCDEIGAGYELVRSGRFPREEYERLLHGVFPVKLRRNNLLTMTFLRTYFSDAAGDADRRSSFYPRVFGSFLQHVAETARNSVAQGIDEGRVSHNVVLEAFRLAAREFISEIRQELYFVLNVAPGQAANEKRVNELLEAFAGLRTPFGVDDCVVQLSDRIGGVVDHVSLRESLVRMKDMGIFESHPGDRRKWRAGRLFKEGLGMKYVR